MKLNLKKNKIINKNIKSFKFFGYLLFVKHSNKKTKLVFFNQIKDLNKFKNYLLSQLKNFNKILNKLIHYNFKIFILKFYLQLNFFKFDKFSSNFIFKYIILLINGLKKKKSTNNPIRLIKNK